MVFVAAADPAQIRNFIKSNQIDEMTVLLDPELTGVAKYRIPGYPTSFVVDQDGDIAEVRVGWGSPSLASLTATVNRLVPK